MARPSGTQRPKKAAELPLPVIETNAEHAGSKAKVRQLKIKNYGCISEEIVIELDNIVVLVGPNNSGKSTILKAYEIAMGGKDEHELQKDEFYEGKLSMPPCITLETQVPSERKPSQRWLDPKDNLTIRERWIWNSEKGKLVREGFDFEKGNFCKEVPYGANNVSNAHRPKPHRLGAFDSPATRMTQITKLLSTIISDKIKNYGVTTETSRRGEDGTTLLSLLKSLGEDIRIQTQDAIAKITSSLTKDLTQVFPKHVVDFDPEITPTDEAVAQFIDGLFKKEAKLTFGPESLYKSPVEFQGNGAQRMLMWAVIRYMAENDAKDKSGRSHILLLDEPELCLHPSAIRDVARTLYELPTNENWQVMISTHSPVFLDLTKDNTTIIRVERTNTHAIGSTTVFRRSVEEKQDDDLSLNPKNKAHLKLLNVCDPYFTEFFFGGKTIVVEGDTEYAAFKHIVSLAPQEQEYRNLHIVRARGKYTLCLIIKLLNRFNSEYSVLHDSDLEKNKAFKANYHILAELKKSKSATRPFLVAALHNFEMAMFQEEPADDESKPSFALHKMQDVEARGRVKALLDALISQNSQQLPVNCIHWSSMEELLTAVGKLTGTLSAQTSFSLFDDPAEAEAASERLKGAEEWNRPSATV